MINDTQTYLRCVKCNTYVNSSEALAHHCPVKQKRTTTKRFMSTGLALEIVLNMAKSLYKYRGEFVSPAKCPRDAELALDTVEELVVNNYEERSHE